MADYTTLKTAVQIAIKANNNNEITGKILQQQLLAMINSLGSGYQLAGILMPSDTPKTDDQRVAYLAVEPGMYEHAGGFEVTELSLLMYDTAWEVHPLGVPFGSQIAAVIKALQDADKANAKAIADEKTSRTTAILAEQQAREQADTTLQENIDKKQDTISDLTTIRTQAAHGQTAFSWGDHSKVGYITGITKAMVEDVLTGNITSHTHTFASLTDKPTTISGYGIRDAYTKAETDRKVVELQGLIDSMFERVYDSNNKLIRVHSNVTISSSGDLVAGGNSGGGGTSGGGKTYLNELLDVQLATSSLNVGDMLMWNGTKYVNIPQSSITPDLSDYATQQWVLDKKYLTSVPVASVVGQTGNITTAQIATALTDAGYKLTDTTYELATTTSNGLMSATDKTKLNGIAENANNYTLPTASSTTKGGIKVGATLSISGEVLDLKSGFPKGTYTKVQIDDYGRVSSGSTLSASDIPSLPWSKITSGKPTTISGYGITDAYTKTETDSKVAALQSLLDSMFERVYDSNNKLIRIHSNVTISSSGDLVAGGNSEGGGTSGGAFTQLEWNAIKALTQSESGLLASAYAVKEAYNELNTAIETLAGKATNVKFTQTLTSGKQIGSISIDGKSTSLFAPANYAWSEVTERPTKLSQFTDDVVSGKYLPLSGGTIESTSDYMLTLNRLSDSPTLIAFQSRGALKGFLGITNDGAPVYLNQSAVSYPLLHSGNYKSYAPKLDGTGASGTWGINISGNAASSTQSLLLSNTSDAKAALGIYFHRDNGVTSLVGNTEGNGVWGHPSDSQDSRYGNASILRIGWSNTYYTDIFTGPNLASGKYGLQWRQIINRTAKDWRTILDSSNYNSYAPTLTGTGATGTWGINISGNADTLDGFHAQWGNSKPWGTIPVISPSGYMDVGASFEFHYDNTTGLDFSTVLACTGNHDNFVYLPSSSGTLALTTDNVASATQLQNARTIWGQSFNGTGNVSGALSGVTDITASGAIKISIADSRYLSIDGYAVNFHAYNGGWATGYNLFDTNNSLIGTTAGGYGEGNTLNYYYYGGTYSSPKMVILPSGNVGIGTSSSSSKLSVNSGAAEAIPSLGALNTKYTIELGYTGKYGTYLGTLGTGNGFIQQGRSDGTATAYNLLLQPLGGNVGIGTTSPSYKLHVAGTGYCTGNFISSGDLTAGSDIRYKDKIQDLRLSVHDIALAPAFTYKWNNREDALVHIGSSAQYWLNTNARDAVYYDKQNDFYHLNYASLALCNTIILARGMETQEDKIARLEDRIKELEERVKQFEQ